MARLWLITDDADWVAQALRHAGHVVEVLDVDDARASLAMEEAPDMYVVDLGAVDAYDFLAEDAGDTWSVCIGAGFTDMAMGALYARGVPTVPNDRGHELELRGAVELQLERAGKAGEPCS